MKKTPTLNAQFLISVVAETIWTGLAGIAVSAEYMNDQIDFKKGRHLTTFFVNKHNK